MIYRKESAPEEEPDWASESVRVALHDIVVDVCCYGGTVAGLSEVLLDAFERASDIVRLEPRRADLVSFLQGCFLLDPGQRTPDEVAREVIERVSRLIKAQQHCVRVGSVNSALVPDNVECDAEFYFSPIPQRELVARLKPLFPELGRQIIGWGAIVGSRDGSLSSGVKVKWAHLTARHFGVTSLGRNR